MNLEKWPYVTTQNGYRFFRTRFTTNNNWPVFAKELSLRYGRSGKMIPGRFRAYEECHKALRVEGKTIDAATLEDLDGILALLFPKAEVKNAAALDRKLL